MKIADIDPVLVLENPELFTDNPSKIEKLKKLHHEYQQERDDIKFKIDTIVGSMGYIPTFASIAVAGSVRQYILDRYFAQAVNKPKIALGLGVTFPLIGAIMGATAGILVKPYFNKLLHQQANRQLTIKYKKKINDILK